MGTRIIAPPEATTNSFLVFDNVYPTLSPKDPNFEEWYKRYKQKFLKKSGGQEPADD